MTRTGDARLRVLLVTSHPLGPPWDSADKAIARLLVEQAPDVQYTTLGRFGEPAWHRPSYPLLSRDGHPGLVEHGQAAAWMLAAGGRHDLIHLVMTAGAGMRWASRAMAGVPWLRGRLVHTVPGAVDQTALDALDQGVPTVVLSEHTAQTLRSRGARDVTVVPLALDVSAWPVLPLPTSTPPSLLFAGHRDEGAGAMEAVKVAAMVGRDHPVRLVLALRSRSSDHAGFDERLREEAAAGGVPLTIVPEPADVPALLRDAAVVIGPWRHLSGKADLPVVVLEAMCSGRPVVMSGLPTVPDLGPGAVKADPGDLGAHAAAVLELLLASNLRQLRAAEAARFVRATSAPEHFGRAYRAVYDRVADTAPRSRRRG